MTSVGAATFYCDESGNTGVNRANPDQPVFTYAGWLVPRGVENALISALDGIRERHRIQGGELKWSKIGKRANGAAIFRAMFEFFRQNASVPFFLVADKDYQTAAKIIETFFDPEYNTNLMTGFTSAFRVKKELAEMVLSEQSILGEFAGWLCAGEPNHQPAMFVGWPIGCASAPPLWARPMLPPSWLTSRRRGSQTSSASSR
jgi:hypothetical protein